MIFTGQPGFVPSFKYQVRVIVKGSIFTKGMEWTGPWQTGSANGPLTISVPTPEDPGVNKKSLVPGAVATQPTVHQQPPPVVTGHSGPPAVLAGGKKSGPPPPVGVESGSGDGEVAGWTTLPPGKGVPPPPSPAAKVAAKGGSGASGFGSFSASVLS